MLKVQNELEMISICESEIANLKKNWLTTASAVSIATARNPMHVKQITIFS